MKRTSISHRPISFLDGFLSTLTDKQLQLASANFDPTAHYDENGKFTHHTFKTPVKVKL